MGSKLAVGINDLASQKPDIAAEWHPTKNSKTAEQISYGSKEVVWWQCLKYGDHEWESSVKQRLTVKGCPYCTGVKLLEGFNDLATVNPELAAEWHPDRNGSVGPQDIMSKTVDIYWWQCAQKHYWDATVYSRNKGSGCPYCAGKRIWSGFNDLATKNPELAAQWHPDRNGSVSPTQVGAGVRTIYSWLGKCGHDWEDSVHRRNKGAGCPYCLGSKFLAGFNDLATCYPALADEWHPTENDPLRPEQVIKNSSRKIVWLGTCGHKWEAPINQRTQGGNTCPHCSGRVLLLGVNDLVTTHPKIAAEWDAEMNGALTATDVTAKSTKKVRWIGKTCGHRWEAVIYNRTSPQSSGCPTCDGKKVECGFNDLACKFPVLEAEWDYSKNKKSPHEVTVKVQDLVWWIGMICGHKWDARVADRTVKGEVLGCPICSGKRVRVGHNDLAFLRPDLAAEWHPTENELTPKEVSLGSNKSVWWRCALGHPWKQKVLARTSGGNNCPYCGGKSVWVGFNDLAFRNPELASEWHPNRNGNMTAQNVTCGSKKKVWWLGKECGHDWEATVCDRHSKASKCPVCAGRQLSVGFNDFATRNPDIVAEWHPTKNGDKKPSDFVFGSHSKAAWKCAKGHEWETTLKARSAGQGCRKCSNNVSKAEREIKEFIEEFGLEVMSSNRKLLGGRKEIDLYIPEKNLAIEYNGLRWHKEGAGKDESYHYDKWLTCKSQGIQLMHIWEDDWRDRNQIVKDMLVCKLGIVPTKAIASLNTVVSPVAESDAKHFLQNHHIQGFVSGQHYLGLIDTNSKSLQAVMVLKDELESNDSGLKVLRYATDGYNDDGFKELLMYATATYSPMFFTLDAENAVDAGNFYLKHGFYEESSLPPDYMYVVTKNRKYKDSLTKTELAALTVFDRIWDAGKTRYRLVL